MKLRLAKPGTDFIFLFVVMALVSVGLVMIFSASPTLGLRLGDSYHYLKRHVAHLAIGMAALLLGMGLDYHYLKKYATPVLLAVTAMLFMVFIPGLGRSVGGAVRWIDVFGFSFQPSEIAKMAIVIYLASVFSSWKAAGREALKIILVALIPVIFISFLVLKQPDLGTTLVMGGTAFIMLFLAGVPWAYLLTLGGLSGAMLVILSLTSGYRMRRIIAFFDPWGSPHTIGFHIIQSLLAIGSGGLFGLGLRGSRQKFFYLPQHYTDFIFSILSEELGFLGALGVVVLFIIFTIRGIRIARFARDEFGCLLAGGIVSWIALQSIINLYVVTGLFPTTGIPLPFISFGGTSLIVTLFAVGVLLNIGRRAES